MSTIPVALNGAAEEILLVRPVHAHRLTHGGVTRELLRNLQLGSHAQTHQLGCTVLQLYHYAHIRPPRQVSK